MNNKLLAAGVALLALIALLLASPYIKSGYRSIIEGFAAAERRELRPAAHRAALDAMRLVGELDSKVEFRWRRGRCHPRDQGLYDEWQAALFVAAEKIDALTFVSEPGDESVGILKESARLSVELLRVKSESACACASWAR